DARLGLASYQHGAGARLLCDGGAELGHSVRVRGPSSNPDAIGEQVRLVYGDRMGPVQEIQAGSGYWSENGALQVFGISGSVTGVWARWPAGGESRAVVPPGAKEVVVSRNARRASGSRRTGRLGAGRVRQCGISAGTRPGKT